MVGAGFMCAATTGTNKKDDLEKVRQICGTECNEYVALKEVIDGTRTLQSGHGDRASDVAFGGKADIEETRLNVRF
jgi:hypothetical protein